ncbi:MAG TPA: HAD family hydrolase [Stenomitos sp.]
MRLVLFDIDGTLIRTKGAGRKALGLALQEVYGATGPVESWDFGGKTDPLLCHELLEAAGLSRAVIDARMDAALDRYLEHLRELLTPETCWVMPGVEAVLAALAADPTVTLGLLTGNVQEGAQAKLAVHGLDRYFDFGAYGCDSAVRSDLPAIAVQRALDRTGRTHQGKEVVIIGDTPADIACGRHLGVRAIAVATGTYGLEALRGHEPDAAFQTLEPLDRVLAAICD